MVSARHAVSLLFAMAGLARAADAPVDQQVIPFDAGRFVVARSTGTTCVVALQGTITRDASFKFEQAVDRAAAQGCDKPWLLLESPGGRLDDGIDLGKAVRARGLATVTRYDCASSCALIFLGGTERVLMGSRARIGFHQASRNYENDERRCDATLQGQGARDMRNYLRWVVPASADALMDTVMRTSCTTIEWLAGQRAIDAGVATKLDAEDKDVFGPRENRRATPEKRD